MPALAVALAEAGVSVRLVACSDDVASLRKMLPQHKNIQATFVPSSGGLSALTAARGPFGRTVLDNCGKNGDTVIHDNGLWLGTNHAAANAARVSGTPLVISPRGMLTPWALKFRAWKKKLAWWLYQQRDLQTARVLHATSQDEADGFRALGLNQPIAIIPNGVAVLEEKQKSEIGNRKSEIRTALFLSRIHPKKGLLDLVHAWAKIRCQCSEVSGQTNWRVVVAGGDDAGHLREIKTEIRKLNLETSFEFIGEIQDDKKWEVYRSSDLFVLPTKSENFGIVIAEALAAGVPVITTRGAPWAELDSHRCGWWTNIGVDPLVAALREALQLTDDQRRAMGERGRQLVEQKYTWPAAAKQMAAVYAWVLGHGAQPACIQTT